MSSPKAGNKNADILAKSTAINVDRQVSIKIRMYKHLTGIVKE